MDTIMSKNQGNHATAVRDDDYKDLIRVTNAYRVSAKTQRDQNQYGQQVMEIRGRL